MRLLRRAGDDLLAGNTEVSGKWQRVLTGDQLSAARASVEDLLVQLGSVEAIAALVSRSQATILYYKAPSKNISIVVAARLGHLMAVADALERHVELATWIHAPNPLLAGAPPTDLLVGEWRPTDAGPASVLHAARATRRDQPAA